MEFKTKKINDFVVKPIPGVNRDKVLRPNPLFNENNPNVLLIAPRKTGKSTVIYNILEEIADKDCAVYLFCGQIWKDKSYEKIMQMLKKKDIDYIPESSFYTKKGKNQLNRLIKVLSAKDDARMQELDPFYEINKEDDEDSENEDLKEIDPSILPERVILVVDDLSGESRNSKDLNALLKANDHMKCTLILSTQFKTDIKPEAWNQFSYAILFAGLPDDKNDSKLVDIHRDLGLGGFINLDKFRKLYYYATAPSNPDEPSRNFLYIDRAHKQFRKNFNERIIEHDEKEQAKKEQKGTEKGL